MQIKDTKVSERQVTAQLSQGDIEALLVSAVVAKVGLVGTSLEKMSVRFYHEDKGISGFVTRAEVTVVVNTGAS